MNEYFKKVRFQWDNNNEIDKDSHEIRAMLCQIRLGQVWRKMGVRYQQVYSLEILHYMTCTDINCFSSSSIVNDTFIAHSSYRLKSRHWMHLCYGLQNSIQVVRPVGMPLTPHELIKIGGETIRCHASHPLEFGLRIFPVALWKRKSYNYQLIIRFEQGCVIFHRGGYVVMQFN